jgi:rifampicin phosphotransferase
VSTILNSNDHSTVGALGGKARALQQLRKAGFNVPDFVVVSAQAFVLSLNETQLESWLLLTSGQMSIGTFAQSLSDLTVHPQIADDLFRALKKRKLDSTQLAVRSSATAEDSDAASFAGQLESFLWVNKDNLLDRIVDVWKSAFSERVAVYAQERGVAGNFIPAVLIQKMVDARVSGVAFSCNPMQIDPEQSLVQSVFGLGHGLVSGELDADSYVVKQKQVIARTIAEKTRAFHLDVVRGEGMKEAVIDRAVACTPSLTDQQAVQVAALARQCEIEFGSPQDIEWAFEGSKLYLLQSRPITVFARPKTIWDNSNIAESYNGVTTPLTFSFAKTAYEHVYRQFCKILAVPAFKIEANEAIFPNMLGLVNGRVYYNLLNWYKLLALLPGYQMNRGFMEQMMGVKEPLPEGLMPPPPRVSAAAKILDGLAFASSLFGLITSYSRLEQDINRFYQRLDEALPPSISLKTMSAQQLVKHYRDLQAKLLTRWDAPLVNDFFAMIFYGLLRAVCIKWCGDSKGTLQNDLIAAEGGIISAKPAEEIRRLAGIAAESEHFVQLLLKADLEIIRRALICLPEFKAGYEAYLTDYGDRCLEELKLESTTLTDEPLILLRSIGQMALRLRENNGIAAPEVNHGLAQRLQAEANVARRLAGSKVKATIFAWILHGARCRIRDRENLRFQRTRLFGRVRRIFLELGQRLADEGYIGQSRDVFYLEVEEVLRAVETGCKDNLRQLVSKRKLTFAQYKALPEAPTRLITEDAPGVCQVQVDVSVLPAGSSELSKGIGCCPGKVRGRVRVILDPRNVTINAGEIIVAKRTDPGWVMLFPAASGLLVEHGSLLSHSAIVARELGLPAIISIPNITTSLRDGELIEMDGSTGAIFRLEEEESLVDAA